MLDLQHGDLHVQGRGLLLLLLLAGLPEGPVELRGLEHGLQRRRGHQRSRREPLVLQRLLGAGPVTGPPLEQARGEGRRRQRDRAQERRHGRVPDHGHEGGRRGAEADGELHLLAGPDLRHVGEDAVEHEVEDHAEGPEVDLGVVVQAFDHLRRHEGRRAVDPAQVVSVRRGHDLREAEVAQLHDPVLTLAAAHVVVRLQVSVHDPRIMDHDQALQHPLHQRLVHLLRDVPEALQRRDQRLVALLHDDVDEVALPEALDEVHDEHAAGARDLLHDLQLPRDHLLGELRLPAVVLPQAHNLGRVPGLLVLRLAHRID
mmetsp:Transcript_11759/g.33495  ORF Transcript_11759/g.33495 Transcript_11759/m.33495 type:complete len:316 (+) Transcript_11759:258-1205(+)